MASVAREAGTPEKAPQGRMHVQHVDEAFIHQPRSMLPDRIVIASCLTGNVEDYNGDGRWLHWTVTGTRGEAVELNIREATAFRVLRALASNLGYEVIKRPEE
jgi:hypothetical protein